MADNVTLLDLSFNTDGALDGLDALIAKSTELVEKKARLVLKSLWLIPMEHLLRQAVENDYVNSGCPCPSVKFHPMKLP